jgi:sphingomyelin phosphodiesterase
MHDELGFYNLPFHDFLHQQDLSYIIMTGDLPPHAIWDSSNEENTHIMKELNNFLRKKFPNITIYPTIGNHEAHPLNR